MRLLSWLLLVVKNEKSGHTQSSTSSVSVKSFLVLAIDGGLPAALVPAILVPVVLALLCAWVALLLALELQDVLFVLVEGEEVGTAEAARLCAYPIAAAGDSFSLLCSVPVAFPCSLNTRGCPSYHTSRYYTYIEIEYLIIRLGSVEIFGDLLQLKLGGIQAVGEAEDIFALGLALALVVIELSTHLHQLQIVLVKFGLVLGVQEEGSLQLGFLVSYLLADLYVLCSYMSGENQ